MGLEYKNRMKNPTKDNKSTLDKWSDDDEIKKISTSENRKEPKVAEENIKEISLIENSVDLKGNKFKDNEIDNKITQTTSDETKESKLEQTLFRGEKGDQMGQD